MLRPQVNINVRSNLSLIEPRGPGVVAVMGTSQWGPINAMQTLTSFNEGLEIFKDDIGVAEELNLIKGLDLLYRNGAGTVYALRVGDGTEATSSINLVAGVTTVITVYGMYLGTYGNNIAVTSTANGAGRDLSITDGIIVESYTNSGNGYTSNITLVSDIIANSQLVTATCITDTYLLDTATQTYLTGGLDGTTAVSSSDYTTAFDAYLTTEDFNVLVVPGTTADAFHSTMVSKLNTRATSDDKYAVFVSGIGQNETIATATARTTSGKRFSLVAPGCYYTHRASESLINLDGSYLACAYAGMLATYFPQISPTHKIISTEGLIVDTTTLKKYYNNGEQEQLLNARITPMSLISGSEMCVRGVTRNTSKTEVWYEQNITMIVDYVSKQTLDLLNPFIGDPNIVRVRNVMSKNVDAILQQDVDDEIVESYQPTVITVGSSPDTVNVAITIKPVFAINFITINLTLDNIST